MSMGEGLEISQWSDLQLLQFSDPRFLGANAGANGAGHLDPAVMWMERREFRLPSGRQPHNYNVRPPSDVCWFRFAPVTSSL